MKRDKSDRSILRNLSGKFGNEDPELQARLSAAARNPHGDKKK